MRMNTYTYVYSSSICTRHISTIRMNVKATEWRRRPISVWFDVSGYVWVALDVAVVLQRTRS